MQVDLGVLYRGARERVCALVSDEVASVPVAATPGWDVHDVVAHLAGVVEDGLAGNMAGAPGEPWTAAQVARGRTRTVAELVAQWTEAAPMMEGFLSSPDGGRVWQAVADLHTHECDLRTALGHPFEVPEAFLAWVQPILAEPLAGLVDTSPAEWFRGRFGRRTTDEVRAYDWRVDPDDHLDTFFIFGRAATSLGEHP
jgi:uncharacterized protein (TIGR03083 family)